MSASVQQLSIEDGGKRDVADRRWALQTAGEIYETGPYGHILELADRLARFENIQELPHVIWAAAAAARSENGGSPGNPGEIIAWARIFRDYVKTGDLPEPPSEAP